MADRYDYRRVSLASKEFARKDINETPEQVNAHIESLRKWVKSMPHLQCPTDSEFLLKFLRVAKFDHAKAQIRLDNFCTVRTAPRGFPHLLKVFNVDDPIVKYFLDLRLFVVLGKNNANETILLSRFKVYDPGALSFADFLSLFFMGLNVLMDDEKTQIYGVQIIVDMENISRKALESVSDPKDMRAVYRIMQDSFPIRIKSQIFYNEPAIFEVIFKIIFFFMNDKLRSRTFRLSQNIQKAEKQIPGLMKVLPKEYNGTGDTLDNIAERWNKQFIEFYKTDHFYANLSVDESKRPPETLKYLADVAEYKGETLGKAGTFTKFENTF